MSKINYVIYRPDKCKLQARTAVYWDQKKILKQVVGG